MKGVDYSMNFKKYSDINLFWNDNQKLLEEQEWYNCLMIGNCIDGLKNGMDNWFLATIENNQTTELIMLSRKQTKTTEPACAYGTAGDGKGGFYAVF